MLTKSWQKRSRCVTAFVELAEELANVRNFNGVMETLCGLNMLAVRRLKLVWSALDKCVLHWLTD